MNLDTDHSLWYDYEIPPLDVADAERVKTLTLHGFIA